MEQVLRRKDRESDETFHLRSEIYFLQRALGARKQEAKTANIRADECNKARVIAEKQMRDVSRDNERLKRENAELKSLAR